MTKQDTYEFIEQIVPKRITTPIPVIFNRYYYGKMTLRESVYMRWIDDKPTGGSFVYQHKTKDVYLVIEM